MKQILVLTGTTGYPMLEESILDVAKITDKYSFILQTKNEIASSLGVTHKRFIDLKRFDCANISGVVGHCGAGTTFWSLENKLRFLAVVDLERADSHQQDLGMWISKNNYGLVIENRPVMHSDIEALLAKQFATYHKEPFQFNQFDKLL